MGALAALLAVTLSCGGDDAPPDDPPPTTAAPTTTTTTVESEVEAAYTAYREMVTRLLQNPDPDDPEIAQRATGATRQQLVSSLESLQSQGRAVRLGDQYGYEVVSVELTGEDSAVLEDCAVDDAQTIDVGTGEVVSEGLATALLPVRLRLEGDLWLVAETPEPSQVWEGVGGCASE